MTRASVLERRLARLATPAGFAVVMLYFLWFAGPAVRAGFSADDLMNMYEAVAKGGFWKHLANSVLFFVPAYRPLGAALYSSMYAIGGMNPLPLHIVCLGIAFVNIWLLFQLAAKLSGSREIGLLAAAIGAFHGNYIPLYYDAANCYDLLSFLCFYSTLLLYISIRSDGGFPNYTQTAAIALLFALAVSAKEIAFSFPLIIMIYEFLWHRGLRFQQYRVGLLSAAIVAGCAAARVWGPDGLAYMGGYQPHYSIGAYLAQLGRVTNELFYRVDYLTVWKTAWFWTLPAIVAVATRSKYLIFCLALVLVGFLPIAFIPPRAMCAAYVPFAGLWAYAGGLLVYVRRGGVKFVEHIHGLRRVSQVGLFCATVTALCLVHAHRPVPSWLTQSEHLIRGLTTDLDTMKLHLNRGARILMVNDPFREYDWGDYSSLFLFRLYYRDPQLEIDKCAGSNLRGKGYAAVLTYDSGKLRMTGGCGRPR